MTPQEEAQIIHGFSEVFLKKNFDDAKDTPDFHLTIWEYCCDPHDRVAIAAPRNHAKTSAVTHVYVLYCALFRKFDNIIIVSNTEGQAIQFLGDIKSEMLNNDELRDYFGIKGGKLDKESEKEIIVQLKDGYKFRIVSRGAQTSLRGAKWKNKRPNLIILDDAEDDESVMNEERRAKLKEWVLKALLETLSTYGVVRVVGTILHFDSFLEGLMPDEKDEFTIKEPLRTYSTKENPAWKSIKFRAHPAIDDMSQLLWPERITEDYLKRKRQNYLDQNMPEGYSQEYLNYPIDVTDAFFRREDIVPMDDVDYRNHESKMLRYYAAIDPAISTKDKRSFTAIAVIGVDSNGVINVVDFVRGRFDSKQIQEWMFDIQRKYSPDLFTIEKGAIEKSLGPYLSREMMDQETFINLNPIAPTLDKQSRARSIQAKIRQHAVHFDFKATWFPTLLEELTRFPRGAHDDQVDALSWVGLTLDDMSRGTTTQEIEDREYEEMVDEYEMSLAGDGTGY